MPANMELSIKPHRLLAASVLVFLISACSPVAAPAPGSAAGTPVAVEATKTSALVSFPTAASESPTPEAAITATLTAPRASIILPLVQLVSPVTNTQISISQPLSITVYAADDAGIARIELYDDSTLVRAENAPTPAPPVFSVIIPWTPVDLGSH
ncbi:MAG TPA: Ig-like domain-containing protein, partial [Anaerolineae bacterium]